MSHLYKENHQCECGYETYNRGNWSKHRKICKSVARGEGHDELLAEKDARIASLETQLVSKDDQLATKDDQLAAKDEQMKEQLAAKDEQLAAKDRQIEELIRTAKRPRTVNNTKNTTQNNNNYLDVNVFGKEVLDDMDIPWQELIADPESSISRLVTLKHRRRENANIRVPNVRDKWIEVVKDTTGVKRWEPVEKYELLADIVENTAQEIEEHIDHTTRAGQRFDQWHDRLLTSANEYQDGNMVKGRQWKAQLDMVHRVLTGLTR